MSSEIKVDTISEQTSANGVAIDGLTIKDGNITATTSDADILVKGNDGGSEITALTFDMSNAGHATFNNQITATNGNFGSSVSTQGVLNLSNGGAEQLEFFTGASSGLSQIQAFNRNDSTFDSLQLLTLDFRVSTSGSEKMRVSASGNVGIGETNPDNSIHITSNTPIIRFNESDVSQVYQVGSFGGTFAVYDNTDSAYRFLINGDGDLSSGGETAPDVDNFILTLKSSDVAHGMTDSVETDSFFAMGKRQSAGGTLMYAMNSELQALRIIAAAGTENTTKGTTGNGPFVAYCTTKSGSGFGSLGSNANMFIVSNNGNTKFIVDAEGDIHADGSLSAYDNYDDAHLVRAYDLSHGKGVIDSKFDKFVSYNHEKLAELNLVGREDDGTPNHFINVTGMQRLHNGAIWQQYEKHQKLANAMYELAKAAVGEDKANEILEQNEIKLLKQGEDDGNNS